MEWSANCLVTQTSFERGFLDFFAFFVLVHMLFRIREKIKHNLITVAREDGFECS
jgi:hypothetical protein